MSKKSLMQDPNMRNYEWGQSVCATRVNSLIEEVSNMDLDSKLRLNKFKIFIEKFRKEWDGYIYKIGKTKPSKYEMKFNYLKTYKYRGYKIKVFNDDYGQQYYFYFNNECHGCGTYNFDYEGCIRYEVDHYLDDIFDFWDLDIKYAGARLKFNNHEHTEILFTYRMDSLKIFFPNEDGTFDIEDIKKQCVKMLDELFASEEFQKSESERKASGNLYFSEMISQMEEEDENNK